MKFTIPANAPAKPFHKHWQFCVGSGHAAMAMRTDYCEQLKQIHDELGIERVRFHGIFSDDMHTYDTMSTVMPMPGSEQVPFYENSFRLPGLVYDNVLKAGMKPFVELSFMPSPMAKRPTRGTFYWKPCIAPPKDEAQWQAYIQKFVRFLLNRYGKEEVETWFFEVWNEPDLKTPFFDGTQEDYFRLYEITAKAVKAVDDKLKVGGPATSNSKWVAAFVDYCKAHDAPVDFITTHQYAGDPISEVCDQKDADHMKDTAEIQAEYKVDFAVNAPRRDGAGAEAVHAALDQHIADIVHGALGRRRDADHADGGQHLGVQAQLFRPDMPRRTLGPGDAAQRQHRTGNLT